MNVKIMLATIAVMVVGFTAFFAISMAEFSALGSRGALAHDVPQPISACRICFEETEGSSQCQQKRKSCSHWSNTFAHGDSGPSVVDKDYWTDPFRDDTDGRGGGCKYQWIVECR